MSFFDPANTKTALVDDGGGTQHIDLWVDFPYDEIDAKTEVDALEKFPLAADGMRRLLKWIWSDGTKGVQTAFRKFCVMSARLDPNLVDGATLPELAEHLSCTKAALSKHSVSFADKFGGLKFRTSRTKLAREHMKQARLRQKDGNGKVMSRRPIKKREPVETRAVSEAMG